MRGGKYSQMGKYTHNSLTEKDFLGIIQMDDATQKKTVQHMDIDALFF